MDLENRTQIMTSFTAVPVTALVKLPMATILREERPRADNWPGLIMEVTEDEIIHDLLFFRSLLLLKFRP